MRDSAGRSFNMLPLLLLLTVLIIGYLAYKLSVYALPCLVGLAAAQFAYATGAGLLGAAVVFMLVAPTAWAALRLAYLRLPSSLLRGAVTLLVVAPAVLVSYFMFGDIAEAAVPSPAWQQVFSMLGSGFLGLAASVRLAEASEDTFR